MLAQQQGVEGIGFQHGRQGALALLEPHRQVLITFVLSHYYYYAIVGVLKSKFVKVPLELNSFCGITMPMRMPCCCKRPET